MSRTYKDKPWKFKNPEAYSWTWGTEKIPYEKTVLDWRTGEPKTITGYWYKEIPGMKSKKKKDLDCEWHWMSSTPSEWTRTMMNRPQRREYHLLEHEAVKTPLDSLEEFDIPDYKKKPHIYYY
jgi:hypothetical protein